jgi:hypothetical protein
MGDPCATRSVDTCMLLQGYKRVLRSNELCVSAQNGIVDVDLDISFTLQVSTFV